MNELSPSRICSLITLVLFLCCCHSVQRAPEKLHQIAIQPIGSVDPQTLSFIQTEIKGFFHCPVVLLPDQAMPRAYLNTSKGERYCADSLLVWLTHRKPDSIDVLVGFTSKDIYTASKDAKGRVKKPLSKYAVWGILGLGYVPGTACLVSDKRFRGKAPERYAHRLRTVFIHEIGHNLGLPHCPNPRCIMNDANETIASVDSSGNDYCATCRNAASQYLRRFSR